MTLDFTTGPTRKWTADEVREMVRTGILDEDEPYELLEGELVYVPPSKPPHTTTTCLSASAFRHLYGEGCFVREQMTVTATEDSSPEPDVAVVRGAIRDFSTRDPGPADVVLVVEVAWTSQRRDHAKAAIYARAGFKTYWLLDVAKRRLEVHEEPTPDGLYGFVRIHGEDAEVALPELPGKAVRVRDLLP